MRIKFPYGSTTENNQLLLPEGYLSVDLERKALRLHDGVTVGGFEMVGKPALTRIASILYSTPEDAYFPKEVFVIDNRLIVLGGNKATNNILYHSTDGRNWESYDTAIDTALYSITKTPNGYIVGGQSGQLVHTTDFVNRRKVTLPGVSNVFGLEYGNNTVAFCSNGNYWAFSTDRGEQWNHRSGSVPNANIRTVKYAPYGYWLFMYTSGQVFRTANSNIGSTWTELTLPVDVRVINSALRITTMSLVNGRIVIMGTGSISTTNKTYVVYLHPSGALTASEPIMVDENINLQVVGVAYANNKYTAILNTPRYCAMSTDLHEWRVVPIDNDVGMGVPATGGSNDNCTVMLTTARSIFQLQ